MKKWNCNMISSYYCRILSHPSWSICSLTARAKIFLYCWKERKWRSGSDNPLVCLTSASIEGYSSMKYTSSKWVVLILKVIKKIWNFHGPRSTWLPGTAIIKTYLKKNYKVLSSISVFNEDLQFIHLKIQRQYVNLLTV